MKKIIQYRDFWNICLGDIPKSIFHKAFTSSGIKEIRYRAFILGNKHYIQTPKMIKKGLKKYLPTIYYKLKNDKKTMQKVIYLFTRFQQNDDLAELQLLHILKDFR